MTSNNRKNYSLRHNQTLPSGDCQSMTINMDTSHSPRWSENSFSWGLMVLSERKEVKRWGYLNSSRNWVLASGTPFPHIGVLRTLCSKLSSTGRQDQFGIQAGKISRAPTQHSSSEVKLHLYPVFHPAFLFPAPKAQNPPCTPVSADENSNNNASSHINSTIPCTRHHSGCFMCMKQI